MTTPGPERLRKLQRIKQLTRLLDNAFKVPGTDCRVGLDPILGIIPGGGDAVSLAISAYIIYQAAQLGVPRGKLFAMAANVGLDAAVGAIPILGDIFDFAFKANSRNLKIIDSYLVPEELPPHADEQRAPHDEREQRGQKPDELDR